MTAGSSAVKTTAKVALRGNWLRCIVASGILLITSLIFSLLVSLLFYVSGNIAAYISAVIFALSATLPLFLGVIRFYWRMLFGMKDSVLSVFNYFSSVALYKRAFCLCFSIAVRFAIFGVILFLPAMIVDVFSGTAIYDMLGIAIPMWMTNLWPLSVILKSVAGVILFFIMIRYYAAPVLVVSDEDMDIAEAIHISAVIARGTASDFIYLTFSFLGWIILSFFMAFSVFTLPYLITAYLVHIRFAVADYNKTVGKVNTEEIPTFAGV